MLDAVRGRLRRSSSWRGVKTRFFMIKRLLLVCFLLGLDARDFVYKVSWLGTSDTFSFETGSMSVLETAPIQSVVTDDMRRGGDVMSGWASFLSTCDDIFPFVSVGSKFFLSAKLINCRHQQNGSVSVLPSLVVTSSVRADSMAWAACQLLFHARRPSICGDRVVVHFNRRYAFSDADTDATMMAPIGSYAEAELLELLDVIGLSYPLDKIVCVEGFTPESDDTRGVFLPHIFGCASPNMYRAAFVGVDATAFKELQLPKGWLTEDALAFLGWRFGIRQNCISEYTIADAMITDDSGAASPTISILSYSYTNFSSHGLAYAIVIFIDMILLTSHLSSISELLKWMRVSPYYRLQLWIHRFDKPTDDRIASAPTLSSRRGDGDASPRRASENKSPRAKPHFDESALYAFFSTSFYRGNRYRIMIVATRVLSWLIIMPNSVIWTWSDSKNMKVQAYLSSIKSWVLVASTFTWVWRAFVKLWEPLAYRISHRAHITNQEIISIASLVALWESTYIFTICEKKWKVERQRVNDFVSFRGGYVAHGNVYNPMLEFTTTTPLQIAWIIYAPLILIIFWSVLAIGVWIAIKCVGMTLWQFLLQVKDPWEGVPYERLTLEATLDSPIRALSIVRYQLSMEMIKEGRRYIRPSCYLDYGIMLKTVEFRRIIRMNDMFQYRVEQKRKQSQAANFKPKLA